MQSLSVAEAMVETPMQGLLTPASDRCKTLGFWFEFRFACSVPRRGNFERPAPESRGAFNQASFAAGAVAARGQQIGASSPAATGGIDAT